MYENLFYDLSFDDGSTYETKLFDDLEHLIECITDPNTIIEKNDFWSVWRVLRSIRDYRLYFLKRGDIK